MAQKKKWMKSVIHSPVGSWLMAFILFIIVKLIWLTCRKEHINPPALLKKQRPPQPVILVHWHEFIPYILMLSPPWISVLNSSHAGAQILGKAARFVGAKPIWGSSNRSPLASLRQLKGEIEAGRHVLITPDGPRGPARKMALGPIALAQLTDRPVMLFACHASSCWRLRSWDKTQIPKPFSKITIYWSAPLPIERCRDKDEQAALQSDLEAKLVAFSEAADENRRVL